jgi:biopolymer transport protein ExbB/TolQ
MFLQTPAMTGNTNAEAMKQMGFGDLIQNFDALGWIVFVTLVVMSFMSWYFIISNAIRNTMVRSRADGVIDGFWNNGSTQDAVWGIYHALIGIAATGNASMNAVAGPVGEALIMTAFGLFTAIPAVLAFNFFNRSNRLTYARFDEFAHDLHDFFATGSRVDGVGPGAN